MDSTTTSANVANRPRRGVKAAGKRRAEHRQLRLGSRIGLVEGSSRCSGILGCGEGHHESLRGRDQFGRLSSAKARVVRVPSESGRKSTATRRSVNSHNRTFNKYPVALHLA